MITRRSLFKFLGALGLAAALPKVAVADETFALPDYGAKTWQTVPQPWYTKVPEINFGVVIKAKYSAEDLLYRRDPIGSMIHYSCCLDVPRLPPSYLQCDGRRVRVAHYPELFAVIGHTYG